MAKKCAISGTGPLSGNKRSHAMNSTKRKWNVNLQKVTITLKGKSQTVCISARTLRSLRHKGVVA